MRTITPLPAANRTYAGCFKYHTPIIGYQSEHWKLKV